MALDLVDYDAKARSAVKMFWIRRKKAAKKQKAGGKMDQGERCAVTAGGNMHGFIDLVVDIVHANGLAHADILQKRQLLTGLLCRLLSDLDFLVARESVGAGGRLEARLHGLRRR